MSDLLTLATSLPFADTAWDWGPGPWFLLVPLFWILVVATFFWLSRGRGGRGSWGPPRNGPSASEILDRRFAEGEISAQEYRDRREVLAKKD